MALRILNGLVSYIKDLPHDGNEYINQIFENNFMGRFEPSKDHRLTKSFLKIPGASPQRKSVQIDDPA